MAPKAMQFKGNGTVIPFDAKLWATGQFLEWPPPAQKPEEEAPPAAVPAADEAVSDAVPAPPAVRRGRKSKTETPSPA